MSETERLPRNRPVLALVTAHWLSSLGLGLVVTAFVTWLVLVPMRLEHGEENPYIGLATFIAVPALLILGGLFTAIGLWRSRGRLAGRLASGVDDRRLALKRFVLFLAIVGVLNLVVGTQVTTRAVHHMESKQFCGSCHVMDPQSAAFDGSHAGLLCVDCHVGTGARGWIQSKMQGTRQLWEVLTDGFERPIPSGIASGRLVGSSETCERCHWGQRPAALRLKVARTYAEDEANTPETTVLTMHVGGTRMGGIHGAHSNPDVDIRFVATDAERQDIPVVEYRNTRTGEERTYVRTDVDPATHAGAERVEMTCVDCHNRVGHEFLSAERSVDRALTFGNVSSSLPYLKRAGVEILHQEWASAEEAERAIPAALAEYYRAEHPDVLASRAGDVEEAGLALAGIWKRNVFPDLGVTWGTYPDNSGHSEEAPGCYRCHAGEHETAEGDVLTKSCFRCHGASAVGETDPEILQQLGLKRPIDQMRRR